MAMRYDWISACALVLAMGCGGDDAASGESTGSADDDACFAPCDESGVSMTMSTSSDATSSSDATESSSSSGASSSDDDATADSSGTGSTSTDATSTSDDSGSESSTAESESTGNPSVDFEVRAFAVPGGLDRIWITAADDDASLCAAGIIVWPMDGGGGGVTLPDQWAWQNGWVSDDPADCDAVGFPAEAVDAIAATGTVDWQGSPQPYPCEIDVDLELDFAGGAAWVPDSVAIVAQGVAVEGC